MRMRNIVIAMLAIGLCLSGPAVFAKNPFSKVFDWCKTKKRSTVVTGTIDSVEGRKVMFKSEDGQVLELTGRKAERVAEHRGATLRVFGNIRKPEPRFPTGGLEIRNFRVLEAAKTEPAPRRADPGPRTRSRDRARPDAGTRASARS